MINKQENRETITIEFTDTGVPLYLPSSLEKDPYVKKLEILRHSLISKNRTLFDLDKATAILATCPALESLTLDSVIIGEGHQNLSRLANLKELSLIHIWGDGNPFESIAALQNLESLEIWGGEFNIMEISDIFAGMQNLRKFILMGYPIQKIPPSMYSLSKLEHLEIGFTELAFLDGKAGNWKNLKNLILFDTLVKNLPEPIFCLPCLEILDIELNCFSKEEILLIKKKLEERPDKPVRLKASFQETKEEKDKTRQDIYYGHTMWKKIRMDKNEH
jgi:Leucine-rich repeat (LRR) protein